MWEHPAFIYDARMLFCERLCQHTEKVEALTRTHEDVARQPLTPARSVSKCYCRAQVGGG